MDLLSKTKVLRKDDDINRKYFSLMKKYGEDPGLIVDYIIAATAWSKRPPLLGRKGDWNTPNPFIAFEPTLYMFLGEG